MKVVLFKIFVVCFVAIFASASSADVIDTSTNEKYACPENQEYSECGNNGCQNTCTDPTFSWRCRGMCVEGCICKEGFLRSDNGTCVVPEDCDNCGGDPNAIFAPCANPCPETCATIDTAGERDCQDDCNPLGGCECIEGYVRNDEGQCIDVVKCPKTCGKNEVWNPCQEYCWSEPQCPQIAIDCVEQPADWKCSGGCQCAMGFVRINGTCEYPIKCQQKSDTYWD